MDARAYYNEHDKFAAAWLRNLIAAGHIAPGDVDERDIRDVRPDDLRGYVQCHFFAGIGVWSHGLRRAGWPDRRPVWTWSEPCQPFSSAGRGLGVADERYLRPHMHHLVRSCRPVHCFGEQVASKDGLAWLDTLQSDMEGEDYAFRAFDLCAAGFGAPHIRQRLYWLAHASKSSSATGFMADADSAIAGEFARERNGPARPRSAGPRDQSDGSSRPGELGNAHHHGRAEGRQAAATLGHRSAALADGRGDPAGPTNGLWRAADWLLCRDGKWRPVEPGTFPLAHGAASRVGRLRAYGNAIVATQAEEFVGAWLDAEAEHIRLSSGVFA